MSQPDETKHPESDADLAIKRRFLERALKDAAFDGFTPKMMEAAAKETGVSEADLKRLFPEGPLSLIAFYSAEADAEMERVLAALDLSQRKVRERIKLAVLTRLSILKPNKEAARRAAALLALPMHVGLATKLMYASVDAMWRAVGDVSTDFNFYTKRAILAGVYGAVLVRWFNDTSEDQAATDAFLDARIENVMQFEKFKAKAKDALSSFPMFKDWAKPKT
jgi:ubiquinone biosynthesis protein COQ9